MNNNKSQHQQNEMKFRLLFPSKLYRFFFGLMIFMVIAVEDGVADHSVVDPPRCQAQDYDVEILIASRATFCTSLDISRIDRTLDRILYQIYPTVPGLIEADMTTCKLPQKQGSTRHLQDSNYGTVMTTQSVNIPRSYANITLLSKHVGGDRNVAQRMLVGDGKTFSPRRCRYCFGDDDDDRRRRHLEQCRQRWKKLYDSSEEGWEEWINGKENDGFLGPFTSGETFSKVIKLPRRITYFKVDFTLFQNSIGATWDNTDAIQVSVNDQSPILLQNTANEDTRFRKNGILSAAENYIKDKEGNLKKTRVALHIDLTRSSENVLDEEGRLLLQFKVMTTTENESSKTGAKMAAIGPLEIKGASACAIASRVFGGADSISTSVFEREMEWFLSEKLTAVLRRVAKETKDHCLRGKDAFVHVNLYKADPLDPPCLSG